MTVLVPKLGQGSIEFLPRESFFQRFSKRREVELAPFAMATQAIALEALMEELMGPGADEAYEEALDGLEGLADFCAFVDGHLRHHGLRLATEDELEAACGPGLFVWGDALPDGSPHETRFEGHRQANGVGLRFNHDPYAGELTRCAVKLGDGGESICGGYPWASGVDGVGAELSPSWGRYR